MVIAMLGAHDVELGTAGIVILNSSIFALALFGLWRIESRVESGRTYATLALLATAGILGRILLEPLPNISPVTVLVLLAGAHFGARHGVALATIITVASNLVLGHGIWTLYQAVGWSLIALLGAYLSGWLVDSQGKLNLNRLMLSGFALGFAFDWFVSLSVLHTQPLSYLPAYLAQGLVYDFVHGFGNVAFAAWLGSPVAEALGRHSNFKMVETKPSPVVLTA